MVTGAVRSWFGGSGKGTGHPGAGSEDASRGGWSSTAPALPSGWEGARGTRQTSRRGRGRASRTSTGGRERSGRGNPPGGGAGVRARRAQGAVGLDAVDLLAERAMRSGRRIGLVVGCLQGGAQRLVGYGRLRTGAPDTPDGGTIFEI